MPGAIQIANFEECQTWQTGVKHCARMFTAFACAVVSIWLFTSFEGAVTSTGSIDMGHAGSAAETQVVMK